MKRGAAKKGILAVFLIGALAAIVWLASDRLLDGGKAGKKHGAQQPVAVEVARIEHGTIALERTFSGELEALAEFVVAPKVGGRVERVLVNIADTVTRGQVVAELDNDEYVQAVARARADLEVAAANLTEARSAFEIADREFERTASLLKRDIASDSEYDVARQNRMAKEAQLKVAAAHVAKAESSLETAKIQLGYTQVTAGWSGGDDSRVVAERFVDEGQTVAANTPLLSIVEIDPIVGIVYATESDYAQLKAGQTVSLTTDAYPGQTFTGRIDRIAPVFLKSTRQARIEMIVNNPSHRLKPGMFIRGQVTLARTADATIVPQQALSKRSDRFGVFIVSEDGRTVGWHEVAVGVRSGGKVQVMGKGLSGRVVTLGLQQLDDGSAITVPADAAGKPNDRRAGDDQ